MKEEKIEQEIEEEKKSAPETCKKCKGINYKYPHQIPEGTIWVDPCPDCTRTLIGRYLPSIHCFRPLEKPSYLCYNDVYDDYRELQDMMETIENKCFSSVLELPEYLSKLRELAEKMEQNHNKAIEDFDACLKEYGLEDQREVFISQKAL